MLVVNVLIPDHCLSVYFVVPISVPFTFFSSVSFVKGSDELVADLHLFCYERDLMLSLSDDNQSEVIEAFNITVSG